MDKDQFLLKISDMFEKWSGSSVQHMHKLPQSGSYREYYRISGPQSSAMGVINEDVKENIAFINFSKHFKSQGIAVPEIYYVSDDKVCYLIEDLGDLTLFAFIQQQRKDAEMPEEVINLYKKIVQILPRLQIIAGKGLNYDDCYPRAAFDKQSMMWDLNYFKYYFLKLAKISFDEQLLEDDFQTFSNFLLGEKSDYFLYRDFQSRNIMIKNGELYFIDYQGGRKGALQYDLASLLNDSKANIPEKMKEEMLEHYLDALEKLQPVDRKSFRQYYKGFVLIRLMQAMGAYGFRGFYERKTHFLQSIPFAMKQLLYLLDDLDLPVKVPHLIAVLNQLIDSPELKRYGKVFKNQVPLTVTIHSFSYKIGLPRDESGNGGGFIFDCRCLHNPGRYEAYKILTGKDPEVVEFLKKEKEVETFLQNAFQMVDQSVERYLERRFLHLQVNFGCTGGQHRSVFCAEKLKEHLQQRFQQQLIIRIIHREQPQL
ncbi:MAG: phosphotransferase [Cyclobacteriaceae bacterium]|nr:phosphotransferase [Cyclobacteriaceae bacterium]